MKRRESSNERSRARLLSLWRRWLQWEARLLRQRFYCRSLSGEAPDGLFVNSDMSVSCNCQDIDGAGQLGNLRETSLETILSGTKAAEFRSALAAGRLPIPRCAACWHLRRVPVDDAQAQAARCDLPSGLSVENTVRCNLNCLSCCRAQILQTRKQAQSLALDDVALISRTLRQIGADYCGYYNLGEPFFCDSIYDELQLIRRQNPAIKILTSTNGVLLNSVPKREAALLVDELLFSIDGVDTPMVQKYQRGGDFDRAYENLRAVVALRDARGLSIPRIYWKYVVFRWNDDAKTIARAVTLARQAGVDCLQLVFARNPWYGMSWRFFLSSAFRTLGPREGWRFRHVWFREPPADVCAIAAPRAVDKAA